MREEHRRSGWRPTIGVPQSYALRLASKVSWRTSLGAPRGRHASADAVLLQSGRDQLRILGPWTIRHGTGSAPML